MNNFWGPLKLNLPRAPNVLRPALLVVTLGPVRVMGAGVVIIVCAKGVRM